MLKVLACAATIVCVAAPGICAAQDAPTPGVTEPAPGVRVIDGGKVPALKFDAATLEATLRAKTSFRDVKKLLGGAGIASVGPAGTTTHMYKVLDTATGKEMVLILFVRGDQIVDHLLT